MDEELLCYDVKSSIFTSQGGEMEIINQLYKLRKIT